MTLGILIIVNAMRINGDSGNGCSLYWELGINEDKLIIECILLELHSILTPISHAHIVSPSAFTDIAKYRV